MWKYYKGKEYYDKIQNYPDEFSLEQVNELSEDKPRIKFEGIFKEGKKYLGWRYNMYGELMFVGEYNSGLYWNGYFYAPGKLEKKKKQAK